MQTFLSFRTFLTVLICLSFKRKVNLMGNRLIGSEKKCLGTENTAQAASRFRPIKKFPSLDGFCYKLIVLFLET